MRVDKKLNYELQVKKFEASRKPEASDESEEDDNDELSPLRALILDNIKEFNIQFNRSEKMMISIFQRDNIKRY